VKSDLKEIAKLKKKHSKWPWETGLGGVKHWLLQNLPVFFVLWLLKNFLVVSEYKLKRESYKFFKYSNVAYGAKQNRRCDRLLVIGLRLVGQNMPDSYFDLVRKAVQSTLIDLKKRDEFNETVLKKTDQLDHSLFDATSWYQLSRGLFCFGFLGAAWVARENSLDSSILEAQLTDANSTTLFRGIQAHIERRELTKVNKIVLDSGRQISANILRLIQETIALLQSDRHHSVEVFRPETRLNSEIFKGLIYGKNVAIVGPGLPHGDYGKEIDEFDTVIRIKFIGNEMLDDQNLYGSKTDITYLGAITDLQLQEMGHQKDHETIKLILGSQKTRSSNNLKPIYEIASDILLYRTPTTSGLRTLNEVLKFLPSNLKLYGFDFYVTSTPYSKQMTEFYETSSWLFGHPNDFVANGVYFKFARARDFSVHDPVSNFCFAQNLYKAGLFDIEPYGKSILELTPYQYVERLEEMLGDW